MCANVISADVRSIINVSSYGSYNFNLYFYNCQKISNASQLYQPELFMSKIKNIINFFYIYFLRCWLQRW